MKNKMLLILLIVVCLFSQLSIIFAATPNTPNEFNAQRGSQVKLTWVLDGGDVGLGVWEIKYTTATDKNYDTAEHDISSSGVSYVAGSTITYQVSNLIPNQTYYFWVRVRDDVEWSTYTSSMSAVASSFAQVDGLTISNLELPRLSWGDYDNDGDQDIAIAGIDTTKVYRNDSGNFVDLGLSIGSTDTGYTDVLWGDYDLDSRLDLLVNESNEGGFIRLYRNTGNDTFVDSGITFDNLVYAGMRWTDYDNDGDIDLILAGTKSKSSEKIKIYRNNGNGSFTNIPMNLMDTGPSLLDVGDYDNDGDMDFVVSGFAVYNEPVVKIYNNYNGSYIDSGISIVQIVSGKVAWGDYDNDSDLDFAISGQDASNTYYTRIYNNNNGNFSSYITLEGLARSSLSWGDYDNDGNLDLLISGLNSSSIKKTILYRNNGDNIFTDSEQGLVGISEGDISFVDFDSDSDLDIILIEEDTIKLYKSFESEAENVNTAPNSPTNLNVINNSGQLQFTWNVASDAQTSNNGLYYEIQVATVPITDSIDKYVVSASTGAGLINFGNYSHGFTSSFQPGLNLNPLIGNTSYYFRVRTVDTSYSKSTWATGPSIFVETALPTVSVIYEPEDTYITNYNVVDFSWSDSFHASGIGHYELQVSTDVGFGIVNYSSSTVITTATITGISDNRYYFKVRAKSEDFVYSNWSNTSTFIVSMNTPLTPLNFTASIGNQVKFSWLAQGGNNGANGAFEVRYSTDIGDNSSNAPNNIILSTNYISGTTYDKHISNLVPQQTYYFWIRAKDNDNDWSGFSERVSAISSLFKGLGRHGLPNFSNGCVSFGDYDNDSDLDLAILGYESGEGAITRIYKNNNGIYESSISLISLSNGSVSWGDYDNDSDLDLAVSGVGSTGEITRIYENDHGNFTNYIDLVGTKNGSLSWADFDNDSYLDLAVTGSSGSIKITRIYKNDNGSFNSYISLLGLEHSCLSWGDYDNDGDVDIAIAGDSESGNITKIYRNDNGTFTDINASLVGVLYASTVWGDYDSDGDLDLVVSGHTGVTSLTKIYRNDSNVFIDSGIDIRDVNSGSIALSDYDADGDLDITLIGSDENDNDNVVIYKNVNNSFVEEKSYFVNDARSYGFIAWGDYDSDNDLDLIALGDQGPNIYESLISSITSNDPPTAPTDLISNYLTDEGIIKFTWDKGTDVESDDKSLHYDIRVATISVFDNLKTWIISASTGAGVGASETQILGNYPHGFISSNPLQAGVKLKRIIENTTYYWQVRSIDLGLQKSVWSTTASTYILNLQPSVPELIVPTNALTTDYSNVTFDWTSSTDIITGVKDYQLQLSTDINFDSIKYDEIVSVSSKEVFGVVSSTYYFRVRARDNLDLYSEWSSTRVFTLNANPPTVPLVNEPLSNLLTNISNIKFVWNPSIEDVLGVQGYELYISTDMNFSFINYSSDTVITTATISNINDGIYYYRVRALDNGGEYSQWASTRSFTIDTTSPTMVSIITPSQNYVTAYTFIDFMWTETSDLSFENYELEISSDMNFSWIDYTSTTVLTTATISGIEEQKYYMRVRVIDSFDYQTYSSVSSFTVDITSPTMPVLTGPINNITTNNINLSFNWESSTDAISGISNYELIISTDINFSVINYSTSSVISTTVVTVPVDDIYYYKVRARDYAMLYSNWSSTRVFTMEAGIPSTPLLTSLDDNLATNYTSLTFHWSTSTDTSGISNYELKISSDINFNWIDYSTTVVISTVVVDITIGNMYYFKVRAKDNTGTYGLYSSTRKFTVDTSTPIAGEILIPFNGFTTNYTDLLFIWSEGSDTGAGVSSYELEVSTDISFGVINYSSVTISTNVVIQGLTETSYYSRLRTVDGLGHYSYSNTKEFVIDLTTPTASVITAPVDNLLTNNSNIKFHWAPSNDNTDLTYQIQISNDINFSNIQFSKSQVNNTTASISGFFSSTYYARVKSEDEVGYYVYSDTITFQLDIIAPTLPSLLAPVDNLTTNLSTLVFDWTDSTDLVGFSNYELDISSNINFSPIVISSSPTISSSTINITSDNKYYYRVRAKDIAGNYSSYFTTRSFTVDRTSPTAALITHPVDNLLTNNSSLIFIWDESVDLTLSSYELQISSDINFSGVDYSSVTISTTSVITGVVDNAYYVRIKSVDELGFITYSSTQRFVVETQVPSSSVITYPINNLTTSITNIEFDWTDSSDASGISNYELEISSDMNFSFIDYSTNPTTSTSIINVVIDNIYYSRVRARDNYGNYGVYSSTIRFTVDTSSPTLAYLTEPEVDLKTSATIIKFNWNPASDLTLNNYVLEISSDINFTALNYSSDTVVNNLTTVTISGLTEDLYYARVKAVDELGYLSYSSTRQVIVNLAKPTEVDFIKPLNGLTTDSADITFVWTASTDSSGIAEYELEISSYTDFNQVYYSSTIVLTTITISNIGIGTLYVHIRAKDNLLEYSEWSESIMINRLGVMPAINFTGVALSTYTIAWNWENVSTKATGYGVGGVTTTLASNATYYEETGLIANTGYTRYAESYYNIDSSTEVSNSATVYTLANAPTDLASSEIKKHSVILSFNGNGGKNYMIEKKDIAGSWEVVVGTAAEVTKKITHLKPDTTYYFSVKARNGNDILTESSTTLKVITASLLEPKIDPTKEHKREQALFLNGKDFKFQITVPEDTILEEGYIVIEDPLSKPVEVDSSTIVDANAKIDKEFKSLGLFVELNMYSITGDLIEKFNKKITFEFPYSDENQDGIVDGTNIPERKIKLYVLDETSRLWNLVGGIVDPVANVIIAELEHFSVYTLISDKLASDNLDNVNIYPNPYKVGTGGKFDRAGGIMFKNLTAKANIRIYNIVGKLVYEYAEIDGDGEYEWDGTNTYGKNLASGIYIYIIKNPEVGGDKAKGKIGIIR